jgi:hypothetical protein
MTIYILISMAIAFYLQARMWKDIDGKVPKEPDYKHACFISIYVWGSSVGLILVILSTSLITTLVFLIRILNSKNFQSGY